MVHTIFSFDDKLCLRFASSRISIHISLTHDISLIFRVLQRTFKLIIILPAALLFVTISYILHVL